LMEVVVFPTPPFPFRKEIILVVIRRPLKFISGESQDYVIPGLWDF